MFKIGNIIIKNNIVLAPMAGISNPSYIKICESMGAGYAITELISSEAIVRGNKKTFAMLNGIDKINIPVAVQIFGSNPETMAKAAKTLVDNYNIKIIDLNMGCPVPKVAIKAKSGSALMKDPDKIYNIVKQVVEAVNVPVTVKIRSGWDNNNINAIEIAQIIEHAGASAITIHPRTRSQGYSGSADWNIIKQVKKNVSIPVIGNGDINSCYDALKMLQETGCDAIMIGRALIGNPWLIKECLEYFKTGQSEFDISINERIKTIKKHLDLLIEEKGDTAALLEIRIHLSHYLKGINNIKKIKQEIMKTKTKNELLAILNSIK